MSPERGHSRIEPDATRRLGALGVAVMEDAERLSQRLRLSNAEFERLIALEYSAFAVDGRPDLGMVIYNPATPADAKRISSLIAARRPLAGDASNS